MSIKTYEPHKSSIGGMDANVCILIPLIIAMLMNTGDGSCWLAWLVPLIFLLIEKDSAMVKSLTIQVVVLCIIATIIYIILDIITAIANPIPYLGWGLLVGVGNPVAYWIIGAIKWAVKIVVDLLILKVIMSGYKWQEYTIPFIGGFVAKFSSMVNKGKAV
jgi:uncharacterized membrane protein